MINEESKVARRKFLGWMSFLSLAGVTGGSLLLNKQKDSKTVKMLTQDGKLVEVDASVLTGTRKRITDTEFKSWVKK